MRGSPLSQACVLVVLLAPTVGAQPSQGAAPPQAASTDWSRPETINPRQAGILDFLDADLVVYDQMAREAHRQGRYEDAARLYLVLLRHRDNDAIVLYNLACAYGRMGEGKLAAHALERALDCGFSDFETLAKDADFEPLRGDFFFSRARDAALAAQARLGTALYLETKQLLVARLLLPPDYQAGKAYPLVIGLHGRGGNCEDFARLWNVLDRPQFIFLSMESPYAYSPSVETRKIGTSWGLPTRDKGLSALADPLVSENLKRAAETVAAKHKVDGVYLLGHSQGVAFAYLAAIRNPDVFRGVMAFAGVLPADQFTAPEHAKAKGKVRIFMAHGRNDHAVPFADGVKSHELLRSRGYDVTFYAFDGDHALNADALRAGAQWVGKR